MSGYLFLKADAVNDADKQRLLAILESYFDTEHDPEQMPIGSSEHQWIKTRIPECATLIKQDNEVVGSTLILPCTLAFMESFIHGRLNEAQLVEKIRQSEISYENMQSIYCCSIFIAPEHRGHGLAYQTLLAAIKTITPKNKKLPLFYWAHSLAGQKVIEKLADALKVDVYARENNAKLNG